MSFVCQSNLLTDDTVKQECLYAKGILKSEYVNPLNVNILGMRRKPSTRWQNEAA